MRRPTRTRRLSIAAIVSLLLFAAVAGAGARSFRLWDTWSLGKHRLITLSRGCIVYAHELKGDLFNRSIFDHQEIAYKLTDSLESMLPVEWSFAGFSKMHVELNIYSSVDVAYFGVPLWPLLLLLLIAPVRWLVSRAANAPAFPVINDGKQE